MPRSLLGALVRGTRQVLVAQLLIAVGAVGLAGWTFSVTSELLRERDRLRERVIQLEAELGARGIVVPATIVVTEQPSGQNAYPGEAGLLAPQQGEEQAQDFDPRQFLAQLFAPAPPMRTLILHARNERDAQLARSLSEELSQSADVQVVVTVLAPRDPRASGYVYYDGRQGRTAAALAAHFNDAARAREVAAWSAQLRGVALPATGEYVADRTDIVLPALPEPPRAPSPSEPEPAAPSLTAPAP